MKKSILLVVFLLSVTQLASACPNCAASTVEETKDYTLPILAVFIAFTYIPMYFFFRLARKGSTQKD